MANNWCWADHGQRIDLTAPPSRHAVCLAISRQAALHVPASSPVLLIQLRGASEVTGTEGTLTLQSGDWLVLARDSQPLVQASEYGFCIGLAMTQTKSASSTSPHAVHIGAGRVGAAELRKLFRLWRRASRLAERGLDCPREIQSLVRYLGELQHELHAQMERCPGRSPSHRHRVFNRLQRARLHLQGHRSTTTRSTELAAIARLSSCYFSRMYTMVYRERPQATASRLRLELAAELLRDTTQPIAEIAEACGFDNCCSFSRAFRAHFGMTASTYRRQTQGPNAKPYTVDVGRTRPASASRDLASEDQRRSPQPS